MADTVRSGTNEKRTDPYRTIRPVRVHTSLLEGAFELEFVELESPQVGESGDHGRVSRRRTEPNAILRTRRYRE